jgi:hypothetical protein
MRVTSTTYQVVFPDGNVQEFETFEEAAPVQVAAAGSQLRTINQFQDVDAKYGVLDADGELVATFGTAHEAAVHANGLNGAQVQLVPV